jgi:diadenosine tetraphosphate (Ap4A) HIT family hydrolase
MEKREQNEEACNMTSCCLCADLASAHSVAIWNKPLHRSENFVVLPSLGALVEGWLLIVPTRHFLCLGALPAYVMPELQQLQDEVCSALMARYGAACAFEHGPSVTQTSVGCGVDHAHLHVVPVSLDLAVAVAPFLPENVPWRDGDSQMRREAFQRGSDYLYLEQPIGRSRIAEHNRFGSQLFRRAIAENLRTTDFNWRADPRLETVQATIDALAGAFEGVQREAA